MIDDFRSVKVPVKKKIIPIQSAGDDNSERTEISSDTHQDDQKPADEVVYDAIVSPLDSEDKQIADTYSDTETSEETPEDVETDDIPMTPFLPDAKVEKRPLGRNLQATAESEQEVTGDISEKVIEPISPIKMPPPVREPHMMPAYPAEGLGPETQMSTIEEGELPVRTAHPLVDDETEHLPTEEKSSLSEPDEPTSSSDVPSQPESIMPADEQVETNDFPEPTIPDEREVMDMDDSLPARPEDLKTTVSDIPSTVIGSIPPQYKEEPSVPVQSNSIYESSTYHQPLVPAPKRASAFLVVAWILTLIVIGIAGGAIYFYLTALR